MSDAEVFGIFCQARFLKTGGAAYCIHCGAVKVYWLERRRLWKCSACGGQFSITAKTIFSHRKLSMRDCLLAVAMFASGAKGVSALQLSRDLAVQYKTAFVLAHKIREAIGAEQEKIILTGDVEVDGAFIGGSLEYSNNGAFGRDGRRFRRFRYHNRRVVIVARERSGRTLVTVGRKESDGAAWLRGHLGPEAVIHADQAHAWDALNTVWRMLRVNHHREFVNGRASTNMAESYFARLRRSVTGVHHRINGDMLEGYAREMAWREDTRKMTVGQRTFVALSCILNMPPSERWKGSTRPKVPASIDGEAA